MPDNEFGLTAGQLAAYVKRDQSLRMQIADNMKKHGGSFVQSLGECLIRADDHNAYKLAQTFHQYMLDYLPGKW